jgi:G:T/U-mismatch repair DNA glycosylase
MRRLVLPELDRELTCITLPSTSPANASVSPAKKEEAWRQILTALDR